VAAEIVEEDSSTLRKLLPEGTSVAGSINGGIRLQYVSIVSWRERLRAAIDASGRRQNAIAASAGVTPETLSRVLSGVHAQPAFETVVRIAHAVGESVGTLLDEPAFFLDGEQRAEVRRVVGYLHAAVRMSPAIDLLSAPNALAQRAAVVPRPFYVRGARLVFQAVGDSMTEAGIINGDLLFVTPTRELRDAAKHIIVCRVAGITLVKQLELRAGRIRLLSRNERYAAIEIDEETDLQLIGIVTGRLGSIP
jgi:transcriptional regulator with XRE-family HTH domain